jgi:uncharacterized membrane protein YidH (DUF202 family)
MLHLQISITFIYFVFQSTFKMFKFNIKYFSLAILLFFIEVLIALYVDDGLIRPYGGDVLVVILMYCAVKAFFNIRPIQNALGILAFAFAIEFFQYFNLVGLVGLQQYKAARVILGTSFSFSDLICYVIGVTFVLLTDTYSTMNQLLKNKLQRRIRVYIWIVIIGLFMSGLTAFPIDTEVALLINHLPFQSAQLSQWLNQVYVGISTIQRDYPFLSYGTDWLAFAHIMLAILFIGPLRDPVKNIWVIEFGLIASVAIFPMAFIAGSIRGIPFFWMLIDCSFGAVTLMLLIPCYRAINKLKALE